MSTFRINERITKSITCDFCCLWKGPHEMPSRIVGFDGDMIEWMAILAGWSTVVVGAEAIRAGDPLNICAICKARAPQDLGRKLRTSALDMDLAKVKVGTKDVPAPDKSDAILNQEVAKGPW